MDGLRMEWVDSNTQLMQQLEKLSINIKWVNQDILNAIRPMNSVKQPETD